MTSSTAPDPREPLGKIVRDVWVAAVRELVTDPKPSWLEPWETLTDAFQREVDMRIGEALAAHFAAHRPEPEDGRRCIMCGRTQSAEDWDLAAHARMLLFERDAARIELAAARSAVVDAKVDALCWQQPGDGRLIACDRAKNHKGRHSWDVVSDAMIDRAFAVLAVESTLPFGAHVADYVSEASEGARREAEMAALKAADQECDGLNRAFVRRVLEAALNQ